MRTEHYRAKRISGQVVQTIDGLDVVLLQDTALNHRTCALASFLGRLPEQKNIRVYKSTSQRVYKSCVCFSLTR